jgi:hypothetical protein
MKMSIAVRVKITLAALVLSAGIAEADPIVFSLLPPDGAISGEPGSTIGWGYRIANPTTFWLEVFGLNADPFVHATADAGPFDFPILPPSTTFSVPYNPAADALAGLFQMTWDLTAPVGFTNSGMFTLSASFYDGDPLEGGNFLEFAPDQFAVYTATVAAPVPEPGTLALAATGLALTGFVRRRRRGRQSVRIPPTD